jgi:hypothetical protein
MTNQSTFELALEQIHNDRIISGLMVGPAFACYFLIWHVVEIRQLNVRFLDDPIQVFM